MAAMLPRAPQPCGRLWRWSSPFLQLLALTAVTFGVLVPLTCQQLLHSYYYLRHWYLGPMSQDFLRQSQEDGLNALHYFERLRVPNASEMAPSKAHRTGLLITIITVQRRPKFHYVLQVASSFHRLLQKCGAPCQRHQILLCNVEADPGSHTDARLLASFFNMVNRYGSQQAPELSLNQFEKEKRDYTYCLERSLRDYDPEHVLLVEDDAVPEEEIFPVLQHLLQVRFSKPHLQDALYVKLYHPERLQRYLNPEPMRILEWFGVGMLGSSLLGFLYACVASRPSPSWPVTLFFALYSMLLVELVGRHYLLELRRLAPALYNVVPATECCTPAMLFSAPSARRVLGYLKKLRCRPGFAKDMALYSLLHTKGERAFVVEPNLVRHVGMFSSLRVNINPKLL